MTETLNLRYDALYMSDYQTFCDVQSDLETRFRALRRKACDLIETGRRKAILTAQELDREAETLFSVFLDNRANYNGYACFRDKYGSDLPREERAHFME